ncbi:uncharacterized protein [Dendrobates tinctorius]|uniref:uncharacterized protein n=1 Tax=Dendrobates tinctorius TaxID=92724 RepID=UPI003CC9E9AE
MGTLDKFILTKDLYLFCRQLTFKMLYHQPSLIDSLPQDERQAFNDLLYLLQENDGSGTFSDILWHLPSQAIPSFALFPTIQIFYNVVSKEISKYRITSKQGEHLVLQERLAVKRLKSNSSFIIKEADKGGNIVLWQIDMYLKEAKRQLYNALCYQVLPSDPTTVFKTKLDRLLMSAKQNNILSKKEHAFLTTQHPVVPTLYLLPKVHKSISELPGRPIVASIGSLFERPCIYLDHFLQPFVISLDSFVQDTSHLIRQLQDISVPQDTILVTMDVESLYTCIGHTLGIEAVSHFLNQQITGDHRHQSFLLDVLNFVLANIYFTFDRGFYKQVSGTAMGVRCAPSYANLFLGL